MQTLTNLCVWLNHLICKIGRASNWAALALMGVIMFDVVSRRFFVLGSTKLQELEWHFHIILFAFCLGYGYLAEAHVRIDLFRGSLSERAQHWVELIGCTLIVVPYCAILVYCGVLFAWESYVTGEISSAGTGLSDRWIIKTLLMLGMLTLLLSGLAVIMRRIIWLFGSEEQQQLIAERLRESVGLDQSTPESAAH